MTQVPTTVTTIHPQWDTDWMDGGGTGEGDGEGDEEGHEDVFGYDLSHIGVPVSITLLVLLVLCMVVAYAKARKRHAAVRSPISAASPPNISGGISPSTYRNYGYSPNDLEMPYTADQPPSYDVVMQTPSNVPVTPILPPAYEEATLSTSEHFTNSTTTTTRDPQAHTYPSAGHHVNNSDKHKTTDSSQICAEVTPKSTPNTRSREHRERSRATDAAGGHCDNTQATRSVIADDIPNNDNVNDGQLNSEANCGTNSTNPSTQDPQTTSRNGTECIRIDMLTVRQDSSNSV